MSRPTIRKFDDSRRVRYAHLKRDGNWIEATKLQHINGVCPQAGKLRLRSRQGTDLTFDLMELDLWKPFMANAGYNCTLYGELFVPGQPASAVKHYMAEGKPGLEYEVFAVPYDSPHACLEVLQGFVEDNLQMKFAMWEFSIYHDGKLQLPKFWPSTDCEGVVYKNGNLVDWMKWKPVPTADLVITGFTPGTGRYASTFGALELSLYESGLFKKICKCAVQEDAVREKIAADMVGYLGKVVEVAYQYIGAQGGLRHPRFVRIREDKFSDECISLE